MSESEIAEDFEAVQEFERRQSFAFALFRKKFADYGSKNIASTGLSGLIARMTDKFERLKHLFATDPAVQTESFADTCVDIANYAIMTGMVADGAWPGTARDGERFTEVQPIEMLYLVKPGSAGGIFAPQRVGDVGYDLAVSERTVVHPQRSRWNKAVYIPTGVHIKCPPDCWAELRGRSSTMMKLGLSIVHGTIDTGFTGELKVGVMNMTEEDAVIEAGQRIAQIILIPAIVRQLQLVDKMPDTERGQAGFGSTGQ